MSFEEQFPELKEHEDWFTDLDVTPNIRGYTEKAISECCLSKQRVKEAIIKLCAKKGFSEVLIDSQELYKELGL